MELIAGMMMVQTVVMLMACGMVCSILVRIERSIKQHAAAAAEAARKQEEAFRKLAGQMGAVMRTMKERPSQDDDFMKDFQKIMNYTGARYER